MQSPGPEFSKRFEEYEHFLTDLICILIPLAAKGPTICMTDWSFHRT